MTPADFKDWRNQMGFSIVAAEKALGLSKSTIDLYEAGKRRDTGAPVEIPHTVALACAALYHRLEPWGGTTPHRVATIPDNGDGPGVKLRKGADDTK